MFSQIINDKSFKSETEMKTLKLYKYILHCPPLVQLQSIENEKREIYGDKSSNLNKDVKGVFFKFQYENYRNREIYGKKNGLLFVDIR